MNYRKAYEKAYGILKDKLLPIAEDYGFNNVIIYGFSSDNFRRELSKEILDFEEEKIKEFMESKEVHNKKINTKIITSMEGEIPSNIKEVADRVYQVTKKYSRRNIRLLIGYSMAKELSKVRKSGKDYKQKIGEILGLGEKFDKIDLIIRTGNVYRLSGFPHSNYTVIKFVSKWFPEMTARDFKNIFNWYIDRTETQNFGR